MSDTTVLMTDMAILVGIFLLGLLAKLFPRTGHRERGAEIRNDRLSNRG